jgi:signal transduction histidine kinase
LPELAGEWCDNPQNTDSPHFLEQFTKIQQVELYLERKTKAKCTVETYTKALKELAKRTDLNSTVETELAISRYTNKNGEQVNITVNYSIGEANTKLLTDPAYFERILTNLVSNAVQAMPDGGKLSINVKRENSKVVVSVKDTGQGIPHEVRERIFTPLVTTKARGQGFGLAVIKKLTEAFNGSIKFESEIGKGTQFTLEFQLQETQ